MESPAVPLETAAELHALAQIRGENHGKYIVHSQVLKLLTELAESGPFEHSVRTGIKVALRAVKDMDIDKHSMRIVKDMNID